MSKVNICIDGFNLALPKGTGVATYARTLAQTLHLCNHDVDILYGLNIPQKAPNDLKEVLFFNELGSGNASRAPKVFSPRWWIEATNLPKQRANEIYLSGRVEMRGTKNRLPVHNRLFNIRNLFERAHRHYKNTKKFLEICLPSAPTIMHWTYPLPIQIKNSINIYTIHDVVPLSLPQTTLDNKNYYYKLIRNICRKNHPIVTVSNASKEKLLSFFPYAKHLVYNTYQTVDPIFTGKTENIYDNQSEIKKLFNITPESYFIFFGSLEPKKNIGRLIEAFLMSSSTRKLVIVGAMGWKNENELRFLKRGIDLKKIIYIDYLPSSLLVTILKNARALLFPSIAEGFGLPVLEAFNCGTPVISSHEGGLSEVAGNAALIVDAYNIQSIIEGINTLDVNDTLCTSLQEKGYERAKYFSMDTYSNRLKITYREILNSQNK